MKVLITILIFTMFLFGEATLEINQSYFIDNSTTLSLKDIIKIKDKFKSIKRDTLGVITKPVWSKIEVFNNSQMEITKRFYNKRAGMDYIDVFITKNEKVVTKYHLGDMVEQQKRDNIFRVSFFDLRLKPQEKVVIFIEQKSFGTMEMIWRVVDLKEFNRYFNIQGMAYFAIFGILVVATIVSFMFYFLFGNRYYLIYAIFTIFSITYQLSVAGFMYEFGVFVYLNTTFNYVVPLLALVFLGFFPLSFFNLEKKEYKKFKIVLKIFIFLLTIFALMNIFYPLDNEILYNLKYTNIINIAIMFTLLILSIKIYIEGQDGAFFYLISNLILFFSILYFILGLLGIVPNSDFYYFSLAIGSISQDIFLALALVYATYMIKKDNEKNKELLSEYSKLSFLGQTFINIYHQWKAPVNNIFNSINHIEIAKEFNDKNLAKIIDENINQIKNNTNYLKDTALNYLHYYKEMDTKDTKFNICEEINSIINLIKSEVDKSSIEIEIHCNKKIYLNGSKSYFDNLLMILFENSINISKKRKIEKLKVNIEVLLNKDNIKIKFQDNAGGIKYQPIEAIFEKNISLSNSSGIGLYMAKYFLIEKLKGNISVKNSNNGAIFEITF